MSSTSRIQKTWLNARMNLICFALSLLLSFFTRKVFLDYLGTEFVGFTGTVGSLLSFLNLAELGIGSVIGYTLYAPIQKKDTQSICEIVSLLGYLYRWIGFIILTCGVCLSFFLPLIFPDTNISMGVIYFGFYAYLSSSVFGYFVNYRASLLAADQRNYIVNGYFQITSLFRSVVQMIFALYLCNFYIYFIIEIVFAIINVIILNIKISRTYPWLQTELKEGHKLLKKYPTVLTKLKQIVVHQFAGFIQNQSAPLFVYGFVSMSIVAIYGNYVLISRQLSSFIGGILNSTTSAVGNLVAEGNKENIYKVYQELLAIRLFMATIITACFYFLASPFVTLWLGEEFILSNAAVFLISAQLFMGILRGATDQFIYAYGLFHDIWAPATETIIYTGCAIIFGAMWGLEGVLLGPVISTLVIVHGWKPFFLYTKGFRRAFKSYLYIILPSICFLFIVYPISVTIVNLLDISIASWLGWFLNGLSLFIVLSISSGVTMYLTNSGTRFVINRFFSKLFNK